MKELFQKLSNLFNFGKERRLVNENRGTVETGGDQQPPAPAAAPKGKIDVKKKVEKMFGDVDRDMGVLTEGLSPEMQAALKDMKAPGAKPDDRFQHKVLPSKKPKTIPAPEIDTSGLKEEALAAKTSPPPRGERKDLDLKMTSMAERAEREEIAMQYDQAVRDLEKGEKPIPNPFKDAVGILAVLTDPQGLLPSADERYKATKQLVKLAQIPKLKDLVIECNYANRYGVDADKREAGKNLMVALQPYTRDESESDKYLAALVKTTGITVAGGRSVEELKELEE